MDDPTIPNKDSIISRLMSKVEINASECWIFTGYRNKYGYGQIMVNGKKTEAHRLAYVLTHGPVPIGMELDHDCHDPSVCAGGNSCPHRPCCNPDHVKPRTHRENCATGRSCGPPLSSIDTAWRSSAMARAAKTHCLRGHEFTDANTITDRNKRRCRTCYILQQRGYRAERKRGSVNLA